MKDYLIRKLKQTRDVVITPENVYSAIVSSPQAFLFYVATKDPVVGLGATAVYFTTARGGITLIKRYLGIKSLSR